MRRSLFLLAFLLVACSRPVPVSKKTPPVKPPAAALVWAIPTLLASGVPVYLPSWLPPSGFRGPTRVAAPDSFALDVDLTGGFPPLTVSRRAQVPVAGGLLPVPGYSLGAGYAGQGAGLNPQGRPWPPFQPYLVPNTLKSPYTAAPGGKNTPPVYVGATRATGGRPPGRPVKLGPGRTGFLTTFTGQGSLGDWTRVVFETRGFLYQVGYPGLKNGGEAVALRMAASMVPVRLLPRTIAIPSARGTLRLELTPAGKFDRGPANPILPKTALPAAGEAFGYRYRILHPAASGTPGKGEAAGG